MKKQQNHISSKKGNLFLVCMLLLCGMILTGCGSKTADDMEYPDADSLVKHETDDGNNDSLANKDGSDSEDSSNAEDADTQEKGDDYYDSIRSTGVFEYDVAKLIPTYADPMSEDSVKEAQMINQAILNMEDSVDFGDMACVPAVIDRVFVLASYSNPLCELVKVEQDYDSVYSLTYLYDKNKQQEVQDAFLAEVQKVIDENIKPEYTDEQRAYAIYKYLVDNMVIIDDNEDMSSEFIQNYDFIYNNSGSSVAEGFVEHKVTTWQASILYMFLLSQLNVDSMMAGAIGNYTPQNIGLLDSYFLNEKEWPWVIIRIEGSKTYNCDLGMDLINRYEMKKGGGEVMSDLLFFGMSDEKRAESFKPMYGNLLNVPSTTASSNLPKCEFDMENYEF